MLFRVVTIFPDLINQYFSTGVLGRAQKKKTITVEAHDLRQWATNRYGTLDDTPYGGGAGMVMKAEPIYQALKKIKSSPRVKPRQQKVILLSARGKRWNQQLAQDYAKNLKSLIFICGRYEGVDERVKELIDEEISIGDFVLTGGEVAATVIIDSIARLIPGVLGNQESLSQESHSKIGVLEYPHYTKPEVVSFGSKKYRVPAVLLSGNHQAIGAWRHAQLRSNISLAKEIKVKTTKKIKKEFVNLKTSSTKVVKATKTKKRK
jgi:tRNA (guanine37-N1)-methyltransferase